MKVTVEHVGANIYTVKLTQGVQNFPLAYRSIREDCEWYAKQVRLALRKHLAEKKPTNPKGN